jgi:DNA polymerase II large subunit
VSTKTIRYYDELLNEEDSLEASPTITKYHQLLKLEVKKALDVAFEAREKGKDPKNEVEIYIAQDVASRTEGLVGPKGIAKRFKELQDGEMSKDEIVVQIAKEIARGEWSDGPTDPETLADQALRTALSYQTEGITAAPIEGIGKVRIKQDQRGDQFLAVYYSGPIRSAGGTAQGVSVYLADIIRRELNLKPYKATSDEVERMLEEVRLYNKIMHLQLPTSDDEIRHAWRNIPIMIHGDPTESEEVSGYRNIDSMDGNRVRGGACLVLNDGLVGRAKKIMKRIDTLGLEGWDWLNDIAKGKYTDKRATESSGGANPTEVMPDFSFASDALMGRPTFSDATTHGGWRLRYGHARNTGIAAIGVHPGLMAIVNDFLAPGTHVRTERPGKGSIVVPIDSIRPPLVSLVDGNVIEIRTYDEGLEHRDNIKEILFLGDMLVGFGEFIQNNYRLCPAGYNEEWWYQELLSKGYVEEEDTHPFKLLDKLYKDTPPLDEVLKLSQEYDTPLHPFYTPAWKYLDRDETIQLRELIWKETISVDAKPLLEKIFIPHLQQDDTLKIPIIEALKIQLPEKRSISEDKDNGLDIVNSISPIRVRDTMGTTIGARMGRPEKAKARKMSPRLHGCFH